MEERSGLQFLTTGYPKLSKPFSPELGPETDCCRSAETSQRNGFMPSLGMTKDGSEGAWHLSTAEE